MQSGEGRGDMGGGGVSPGAMCRAVNGLVHFPREG